MTKRLGCWLMVAVLVGPHAMLKSAEGLAVIRPQAYPRALRNPHKGFTNRGFGYRFILEEMRYPGRVEPEQTFAVAFDVRNTGSAPFYHDWPVELYPLLLLPAPNCAYPGKVA